MFWEIRTLFLLASKSKTNSIIKVKCFVFLLCIKIIWKYKNWQFPRFRWENYRIFVPSPFNSTLQTSATTSTQIDPRNCTIICTNINESRKMLRKNRIIRFFKETVYLGSHDTLTFGDQIALGAHAGLEPALPFVSLQPGNHPVITTSSTLRLPRDHELFVGIRRMHFLRIFVLHSDFQISNSLRKENHLIPGSRSFFFTSNERRFYQLATVVTTNRIQKQLTIFENKKGGVWKSESSQFLFF